MATMHGRRRHAFWLGWAQIAALALVLAGGAVAGGEQEAPATVAAPVTGIVPVPAHNAIVTAVKSALDYYRPTYPYTGQVRNGWSWSTYFQGVHAAFADTAGDQKYLSDGLAWGASTGWTLTAAEADPDSVKAGQTYVDLNRLNPSVPLTALDARMAADLAGQPTEAYWWADALFMGLPTWTRQAARTGDPAYLDKMDRLYAWSRDSGATRCAGKAGGLYDATEHLWYRDCDFVGAQDPNGAKVFWSRGNGWVIAAMAQVVATLPPGDPRAEKYRQMLVGMAGRLRSLQGSDGFWRSSLLDPALHPQPETSGTALITYALAYAVDTGLLDAATYLPVVARAWSGLTTTALRPSGFLTSCQQPGNAPGTPYTATAPRVAPTATSAGTLHQDSPPFCVGALLLAGSRLARLSQAMSTGRPVRPTAEQAGNEASRAVDGDMTTRWSAQGFPQSLTVDLGTYYRAGNSMVVAYEDRVYRYRIDTSTDGVSWVLAVDRTGTAPAGTAVHGFAYGIRSVRYARLTVVGVYGSTTNWVSIREFGIHDAYRPRPDLARARPTTATSSQAAYPPGLATDGDSRTFWVSAVRPDATVPQRLTVDLQSTRSVDTVRVFSRRLYGPADVAVLASTDGSSWSVLATARLPDAEGPHWIILPPTPVRWLALQATGSYSADNVQVEDFEAYGG